MKEYKFINYGEDDMNGHERSDEEFTDLINNQARLGWEVVSHSSERYWGLTVIFSREAQL